MFRTREDRGRNRRGFLSRRRVFRVFALRPGSRREEKIIRRLLPHMCRIETSARRLIGSRISFRRAHRFYKRKYKRHNKLHFIYFYCIIFLVSNSKEQTAFFSSTRARESLFCAQRIISNRKIETL